MVETYQEFFPQSYEFTHLADTVQQYFSPETPLWWVTTETGETVACLWMGNAIAQMNGERYSHIFLLYVKPDHRRRGIGTALMKHAQNWAKQRGDAQIGLQVFSDNTPALNLYSRLGYSTQSLLIVKSLEDDTKRKT